MLLVLLILILFRRGLCISASLSQRTPNEMLHIFGCVVCLHSFWILRSKVNQQLMWKEVTSTLFLLLFCHQSRNIVHSIPKIDHLSFSSLVPSKHVQSNFAFEFKKLLRNSTGYCFGKTNKSRNFPRRWQQIYSTSYWIKITFYISSFVLLRGGAGIKQTKQTKRI